MASLRLEEDSLKDFSDQTRLQSVLSGFKRRFEGNEPSVVVRVPGRVNLIGEHVDYAGYPVLPMAIEQDVLIAAALDHTSKGGSAPTLRVENADTSKYVGKSLELMTTERKIIELESDSLVPWSNYLLCGLKGVVEELQLDVDRNLICYVDGAIIPNAGLSSSSALVVAAAIAGWWAWSESGSSISRQRLASVCARSERYIGTEGGGMDQAIALLASPNIAKLINFEPELSATDVRLPDDAVVVVANSLVEANKADEATSRYNDRVAECRLATLVLAKALNLEDWKSLRRLGHFQIRSNLSLKEALKYAEDTLRKGVYTLGEISEELNLSGEEIRSILPESTRQMDSFKLRSRAQHVFSEADRVNSFANLCRDESMAPKDKLTKLGQLMVDSHRSCAEFYECSHPKVDQMVQLAMELGAYGARITGAGWGGCIVALLESSKADEFVKRFKSQCFGCSDLSEERKEKAVFKSTPSNGAQLFKV